MKQFKARTCTMAYMLALAWMLAQLAGCAAAPADSSGLKPASASSAAVVNAPPAKATAAPDNSANSARDAATTITVHFQSRALGRETSYIAVLPAVLEKDRRYPVVYLLHGAYGNYQGWTRLAPLRAIHAGRPLIIVTPDGGEFGWYVDSPLIPSSKIESMITQDLIADVDARFPTLARREGRALSGLSMGGHGALSLAAKHPDLFCSAGSMSGILRLQNHPAHWRLDETLGKLPGAADFWRRNSVYDLVDKYTSAGLTLMIDCGTSDTGTGAITDARQVHERLTNRGIAHTYKEFPGGHTWKYWSDHVGEHLDFHQKTFDALAQGKPPATGNAATSKWHKHYMERALLFEAENQEKWSKPGAPRPFVLLGSSSFELLGNKYKDLTEGYPIANRGISADGIGRGNRGILHRLNCSAIDCNPRAVYFLNGRNDLQGFVKSGKPTPEEVADCMAKSVRRVLRETPSDTQIVIISDFPTRDTHAPLAPIMPLYNALLRRIAESNGPRVSFLDVFPDLADEKNLLRKEFSADGLHLSRAGYEVFTKKLRASFDEIAKMPPSPAPASTK